MSAIAAFAMPLQVHIETLSKGSLFRKARFKVKSVTIQFVSTMTIGDARKMVASVSGVSAAELDALQYDLYLPTPYNGQLPRFLGDGDDDATTLFALGLRRMHRLEFKPNLRPEVPPLQAKQQQMLGAYALFEAGLKLEDDGDFTAAAFKFKQAADAGIVNGLYRLGRLVEEGAGIERDLGAALRLYQAAAKGGVYDAARHLGDIYFSGREADGLAPNHFAGLQCWLLAVQLSDGEDGDAAFSLGCTFHTGIEGFLAPDLDQAVNFYQLAVAANNVPACSNLGFCHFQGYGTEQNYATAVAFFQRGSDLDCVESTFMLAICFELGRGVKEDLAMANKLYRKLANMNLVDGAVSDNCAIMVAKAVCHQRGFGVPPSATNALARLHQAVAGVTSDANLDAELLLHFACIWAMFKLGELYWNGAGVPVDANKAVVWFDRAAQLGHLDAQAYLSVIRAATSRTKLDGDTYERLGSSTISYARAAPQPQRTAERRKLSFAPAASFWYDVVVADDAATEQVSWPRFSSAVFCELLAPNHVDWPSWRQIEQRVRAMFDANNDGEVSFDEYEQTTSQRQQTVLAMCMSLLGSGKAASGGAASKAATAATAATTTSAADRQLVDRIAGKSNAKFEEAVAVAAKQPDAVMEIVASVGGAMAASQVFATLSVVADCSGAIALVLGIAAAVVRAHFAAGANDQRVKRLCERLDSLSGVLPQVLAFVRERASPKSVDTIEALKRPLEHLVVAMRSAEAAVAAWHAVSVCKGKEKIALLKRWVKRTANATAHADRLDDAHRGIGDALQSITTASALRTAINTSAWADEDEQDKAAWLGDLLQRDAEFKQALSADVSELKGDLRKMGTNLEQIMSTHIVMINSLEEMHKKFDAFVELVRTRGLPTDVPLVQPAAAQAAAPAAAATTPPPASAGAPDALRRRRSDAVLPAASSPSKPHAVFQCSLCTSSYALEADLKFHTQKRHGNGATPPGTPPAVYPVRTAGTPPAGSGSGGYANPHMLADARKSASSSQVVRRTGSTAAVAVLTSPAAGDVSAAAPLARTSQHRPLARSGGTAAWSVLFAADKTMATTAECAQALIAFGVRDRTIFVAADGKPMMKAQMQSIAAAAVSEIDLDDSGTITKDELEHVLGETTLGDWLRAFVGAQHA
jgi:TPR repeat protein